MCFCFLVAFCFVVFYLTESAFGNLPWEIPLGFQQHKQHTGHQCLLQPKTVTLAHLRRSQLVLRLFCLLSTSPALAVSSTLAGFTSGSKRSEPETHICYMMLQPRPLPQVARPYAESVACSKSVQGSPLRAAFHRLSVMSSFCSCVWKYRRLLL